MMKVRFPSGLIVVYRGAVSAVRSENYTDLYEEPGRKGWIAQVPNSCLIESQPANNVYHEDPDRDRRLDQFEYKLERALGTIKAVTKKPKKKINPAIQRALNRGEEKKGGY